MCHACQPRLLRTPQGITKSNLQWNLCMKCDSGRFSVSHYCSGGGAGRLLRQKGLKNSLNFRSLPLPNHQGNERTFKHCCDIVGSLFFRQAHFGKIVVCSIRKTSRVPRKAANSCGRSFPIALWELKISLRN